MSHLILANAQVARFAHLVSPSQLDYFIRSHDLGWFDHPTRPAPPLYTRPRGTNIKPACATPTGPSYAPSTLVQLTAAQVQTWHAA